MSSRTNSTGATPASPDAGSAFLAHAAWDVAWLPWPNRIETVIARDLPDLARSTSAFVLAFDKVGRLLMTVVRARGLDIPGGHIEQGETAEEAARREVLEETGCTLGDIVPVGFLRLLVTAPPSNYRYPAPESFQVFYAARISQRHAFAGTAECAPPELLLPDAAERALAPMHLPLYHAARVAITPDLHARAVSP